jgi:hypothetical protein
MTPPLAAARRPAATLSIFFGVACALLLLHANRLMFSLDEGIMFEAAQRMLEGKKLYADFFGYMSPGGYWLQELAFRLFGLSLRAGRLIIILDFAAMCALTFSLAARLVNWKTALAVVTIYFGLVASNPVTLIPGHRWDSAAISLLSIVLCVKGADAGKNRWWIAAGALAALAIFCTPSTAVFIPITCAALLSRSRRRFLLPYVAAASATAAVFLLFIAAAGYLRPFIEQMLWLNRNYAAVNITPYGYLNGDWSGFIQAISATPLLFRPFLLLCAALPAVLPVVALVGWGAAYAMRKTPVLFPIPYLLACMAGYILTTYPRPDMSHLNTVSPLSYVLVAVLVSTTLKPPARVAIFLLMLPWAVLPLIETGVSIASEASVSTPVGGLRVEPGKQSDVRRLLTLVQPGHTLYVHPYLPLFYFLTQAKNPTRFSYLAPGMMTAQEEKSVLQDLERNPPEWVLYLYVTQEAMRGTFPSGKNLNPRFEKLETWIHENYAPLPRPLQISGYQLLARKNP